VTVRERHAWRKRHDSQRIELIDGVAAGGYVQSDYSERRFDKEVR
jgi:hypothetical protein